MSSSVRQGPPFATGDVVLWRIPFVDERGDSPSVIGDVRPVVVVEDGEELTMLWLPAGAPTKRTEPMPADRPRPWREGEWRLVDDRWRWNTLAILRPGQWRATWVWWSADWEFLGWYVNLEEPARRTPLGFDARDLQLDIVVDRDRRWRWKDEDDLERSVDSGVISPGIAERARIAGEDAIAEIEAGAWPFTDDIQAWRPDPTWPAPDLSGVAPEQLLALHDEAHWRNPKRL